MCWHREHTGLLNQQFCAWEWAAQSAASTQLSCINAHLAEGTEETIKGNDANGKEVKMMKCESYQHQRYLGCQHPRLAMPLRLCRMEYGAMAMNLTEGIR